MPRTKSVHLLVLTLLAVFAIQAVSSMQRKSVTTDEIMYVTAGYYHLRTGEFDYNRTNPPFVKLLTALPLLYLDPVLPEVVGNPETWSEVEQWQYARQFLYGNSVDADSVLFASRLPIVGLGLLLGWYTYLFAFRLYGSRAAVVALLLFAFSPSLLAHARLATQDLALATFGFVATYYFWRLVERPGWLNLSKASAFYALAVVSKTSAILFAVPLVATALLIVISGKQVLSTGWSIGLFERIQRSRLRESMYLITAMIVFGVVSLAAINLVYGFTGSFVPAGNYDKAQKLVELIAQRVPLVAPVLDGLLAIPVPIPESMIRMLEFQASRVSGGNNIYFHGNLSHAGWWYVMPAAFAIKSPIPFLIMAGFAVVLLVRKRQVLPGEWCLIALAAYVLCLFSYLRTVSIGTRYILIVYPCLHVVASGLLRDGVVLRRAATSAAILLLAWYSIGTIRAYPDYLPYFNGLVGGPKNGYKYLADSYVDWGQDLPALKAYMAENDIDKVRLAYFGSGDASYYGIDYDYLPSVGLAPTEEGQFWWFEKGAASLPDLELVGEPIAISVTLLAGVFYPGYYAPLREIEPVDNVGHSILIFEPNNK